MGERNVGWSLGSFCPFDCTHCYSRVTRNSERVLQRSEVDRIVAELNAVSVGAVTLGGNEPIYTSGPDPRHSLLPYILEQLHASAIRTALVSSGPTFQALSRHFPRALDHCSVFAVSLDSPFREEHDTNRGALLFDLAVRTLRQLKERGKTVCILYCVTANNCSADHLDGLVELCEELDVPLRVNTYKHGRRSDDALRLQPAQYWDFYGRLLQNFRTLLCTEPALLGHVAALDSGNREAECDRRPLGAGRPCGSASFRIGNLTPAAAIPVTPCMYRPDHYTSNLLEHNLSEILNSTSFAEFARSKTGSSGCLGNAMEIGEKMTDGYAEGAGRIELAGPFEPGPFDLFDNYICTWIGRLH